MSELKIYSWVFLIVYMILMLGVGFWGAKRVKNSDDFATARSSFGPIFLALAFASSAASGGTFMGLPALAYEYGVSALWYAFLYPIGVYFGVLICAKLVSSSGSKFGNRSIPEFLGDRYQSEFIRIAVAIFSLLLLFYLSSQLVAGLVIFEQMLGLSPVWALTLTCGVLTAYVVLGGAHADILTDGLQGSLMLLMAIGIGLMFFFGIGIEGNLGTVFSSIEKMDEKLISPVNERSPIAHSYWAIISVMIAHIPLGMLPHVGNKLWALKSNSMRQQFLVVTFAFGMIMPLIALGGILARFTLGDALFAEGSNPNESIPALFIEIMPTWLAALLSIAVLSAIMSTADGLVVSSSQVFANDIYRKSLVPRFYPTLSQEAVDRRILSVSRWSTVLVLVGSTIIGWMLMDMNIAMLLWSGSGGMMAALAGPLLLGAIWKGVTKSGAIAGIMTGPIFFLVTYMGFVPFGVWGDGVFGMVMDGWALQGGNPFKSTTIAMGISVTATIAVSLGTKPLPEEHLNVIFPSNKS